MDRAKPIAFSKAFCAAMFVACHCGLRVLEEPWQRCPTPGQIAFALLAVPVPCNAKIVMRRCESLALDDLPVSQCGDVTAGWLCKKAAGSIAP